MNGKRKIDGACKREYLYSIPPQMTVDGSWLGGEVCNQVCGVPYPRGAQIPVVKFSRRLKIQG